MTATDDRFRWAVAAFVGHAPLLRFRYGVRLGPKWFSINIVVLVATVAVTAWRLSAGDGAGAVAAWLAGHFGWSAVLASLVYAGQVGARR